MWGVGYSGRKSAGGVEPPLGLPSFWVGKKRVSGTRTYPRLLVRSPQPNQPPSPRCILRGLSSFYAECSLVMIHFLTLLPLQKSKVEDNGGFAVESTAGADSPEAAVPCARPRRLKKPVQYLEESDEDDMV